MGKAKTSRKGKKAWRKNIPTDDVDRLIEYTAREERTGGPVDSLPDSELFFVDKLQDSNIQKKTLKYQNKVLHCDSILQRNSLISPLLVAPTRKTKFKKKNGTKGAAVKEIKKPIKQVPGVEDVISDIWAPDDTKKDSSKKSKEKRRLQTDVPAVEVDAPGCSYNPTFADHQDALGLAVAQEMQNIYKKELEPEPLPRCAVGPPVEDEDVFFLDVDEVKYPDDEETLEIGSSSRVVKMKKLTRADINKRKRKREMLRVEKEIKKRKTLNKEISMIPKIVESIEAEEKQKEKVHIRRVVSRQERLASCPPRLGKTKFKPEPVQVLLTEEVTGSLRKLKGCHTLARDRFKSLQRRGILEPRVPARKKVAKMRVEYVPGTKGLKERESHATLMAEIRAKKHPAADIPL